MLWQFDDAFEYRNAYGGWVNHGGEKTWIWRQDDWKDITGRAWPPPDACELVDSLKQISPLCIETTSPLVAGYDVRVQRTISLAASGTALSIKARLLPGGSVGTLPQPFAPWSVIQVPAAADGYYLRSLANRPLNHVYLNSGKGLKEPLQIGDSPVWKLTRTGREHGKIGCDGDLLAIRYGAKLFVAVSLVPANEPFEPGARVQLYTTADVSGQFSESVGPYSEIEFTAPLKPCNTATENVLEVVWNLIRIPADYDDAAVAGLLADYRIELPESAHDE